MDCGKHIIQHGMIQRQLAGGRELQQLLKLCDSTMRHKQLMKQRQVVNPLLVAFWLLQERSGSLEEQMMRKQLYVGTLPCEI